MEDQNQIKKARTWAMLCHLSALLAFIGIPCGNLLGPLVIWLIFRNEFPLVDQEGKEALNFQISFTIYALIAAVLVLILVGIGLIVILAIADIILVIMATVKVNNGEKFKYPLTLRFLK